MSRVYNKHDYILNRDLTPAERLEPQRVELRHSISKLEDSIRWFENAGDRLTEKELQTIAENVHEVYALIDRVHKHYYGLG